MAFSIAFVPNLAGAKASGVALADIPDVVKTAVEDMYAAGKENPNGKFRMTFESKSELLSVVAQMTSYCAQRPAGPVRLRKSPSRGLADNVGDFRVTDIPVESEKATQDIKNGVDAVKAVAPVIEGIAAPAKATGRKR